MQIVAQACTRLHTRKVARRQILAEFPVPANARKLMHRRVNRKRLPDVQGTVTREGRSSPMGTTNGTRPLIRPEHLGRALEVVASMLQAPEPAVRFRAAALYLEAARDRREFSVEGNGTGEREIPRRVPARRGRA